LSRYGAFDLSHHQLGWVVVSILFSWYAENFGSYNKTYGSLGALIAFSIEWRPEKNRSGFTTLKPQLVGFVVAGGGDRYTRTQEHVETVERTQPEAADRK
jgi:Virulence factor BrkB